MTKVKQKREAEKHNVEAEGKVKPNQRAMTIRQPQQQHEKQKKYRQELIKGKSAIEHAFVCFGSFKIDPNNPIKLFIKNSGNDNDSKENGNDNDNHFQSAALLK